MTEEQKRGIREEPDTTCMTINKIQGMLRNACECFETLREANSNIRAWGEAWKDYAIDIEDTHEKEMPNLKSEIESLTDEVNEMKLELRDAETELNRLYDRITELETGNE